MQFINNYRHVKSICHTVCLLLGYYLKSTSYMMLPAKVLELLDRTFKRMLTSKEARDALVGSLAESLVIMGIENTPGRSTYREPLQDDPIEMKRDGCLILDHKRYLLEIKKVGTSPEKPLSKGLAKGRELTVVHTVQKSSSGQPHAVHAYHAGNEDCPQIFAAYLIGRGETWFISALDLVKADGGIVQKCRIDPTDGTLVVCKDRQCFLLTAYRDRDAACERQLLLEGQAATGVSYTQLAGVAPPKKTRTRVSKRSTIQPCVITQPS